MSNHVITAILRSHPCTEGFWPDHIARLALAAAK